MGHVLRIEALVTQWVALHHPGSDGFVDLVVEFLDRAYADFLLAVFGAPDRERGAPEAAARQVPVLDVLQPLAEASGSRGFRLPSDSLVQGYHLVLDGSGLYEPCIQGIVEYRLVRAPAVRIAMDVLCNLEGASVSFELHAYVNVKGGGVRGD